MKKRICTILLALLLCLTLTPTVALPTAEAADGVVVNSTNFPDATFRSYVKDNFDADNNGSLSASEIANVTRINVDDMGISSLQGLGHFWALEELYCSGNNLKSLILSYNKKLTSLDCGFNLLKTLDVSKNTALTWLYCTGNQLTALDVSKNTALRDLNCGGNLLKTLDVSKNTNLTTLDCYSNQLKTLDVSKNTALGRLDCAGNQLTTLDVSKNTELGWLDCNNNQLTALDVSKNTDLTRLECDGIQLTALDVSKNTELRELHCAYNQLTALDVSKNTALGHLDCDGNQLTALDVSKNTRLEELYCADNMLKTLDVSKNTELWWLECEGNPLSFLVVWDGTWVCRAYTGYDGSEDPEDYDEEYDRIIEEYTTKQGWEYYEYTLYTDYQSSYNSCSGTIAGRLSINKSAQVYIAPVVPPTISSQPKNISGEVGETVSFKVSATGTGLQYHWQFRKPGGSWTGSGATGHDTATLNVKIAGTMNGYQYRCVITDVEGNKVITNAAALTVLPAITAQPVTIGAAKGSTAKFTVAATGAGLQYQWQFRKPGGSWTNSGATGAKTATLSVTAYMSMSGYQYRCRITDANGLQMTSSAATLRVADMTISAQPHDITAPVGESALFKVSASGSGLTYQWQFRKPGGSWTNSGATGAKTATLRIVTYGSMNGYQYRCVITDAKGIKVITNVAALRAKTTITAQPKSVTVTSGTTTKFTVTATGAGLQYQWQFKKPGGSWTNSGATGAKTATLSVTAYKSMSGNQYRCVITDANGSKTYSSAVTLTVK